MSHMGERYATQAPGVLGRLRGLGKKYCQHGHRLTDQNTIVRREGSATYLECRTCRKETVKKLDLSKIKKDIATLVDFVNAGGTITQARHQKIMTQHSWEAVMAQQPQLAGRLKKISRVNFGVNMSTAYKILHAPSVIRHRHADDEIFRSASNAVPPGVGDRLDIISMMVLAHLEGKLPLRAMSSRWPEYRKEHVRITQPRFNPLAHRTQRHLPVMSMESTMLFSQDSDGVALGTMVSDGFWTRTMSPEDYLIIKEGEAA